MKNIAQSIDSKGSKRRKRGQEKGSELYLEMKLYRILGVQYFKELVLALEGFRHRRDGGKNINYHLSSLTVEGMHRFYMYFIYHVFLHGLSICNP